jgi:hypothetical protein
MPPIPPPRNNKASIVPAPTVAVNAIPNAPLCSTATGFAVFAVDEVIKKSPIVVAPSTDTIAAYPPVLSYQ